LFRQLGLIKTIIVIVVAIAIVTTGTIVAFKKLHGSSGVSLTGMTWTPVRLPLPANAVSPSRGPAAGLNTVACPDARTCVAVGYYSYNSRGDNDGLIETFSNGAWQATQAPLPADVSGRQLGTSLAGLACPTPGYCIAAGTIGGVNTSLHSVIYTLSSGRWTATDESSLAVNGSQVYISEIACTTTTSCVAAGTYLTQNDLFAAAIATFADGT
jgi:hypothetical protein